jgi:hypothetical protein
MTMANLLDATALDHWKVNPVAFIEQLINPDTGEAYELLEAEKLFLAHMFTLDDNGRLLYPDQIYSSIKKSGKTVFGAIIAIVMVLLYGGRYAEIYCVANDLEQAQSRVYEMCRRIIEASPLLQREARVSNDRILFPATGATITPLASDYASAAGGHPTLAIFDEIWGFVSERGRRLWDEMVPVPTRKISARLIVSHAGWSGESELLEELYRRGLQQPEIGPSLRAGDGLLMFWSHVPIAPWQTDSWLASMRRSLRPPQYLRMIENRFTTTESSFIDMAWWDECVDPDLKPVVSDRSLPVWCGVDASTKRDSTALAAVTWSREHQHVRLINHKIFTPSLDRPIDFEAQVEQTLINWSEKYNLQAIYYDPFQMVASSQRLQRAGLPMIEYTQNVPNLTESSTNIYELIKGRNLSVYADEQIRTAVSRAVAIETPRGWRIGKEKQTHKIDIIIALAMASLAAVKSQATSYYNLDALTDGPLQDDPDEIWRQQRLDYHQQLLEQFGRPASAGPRRDVA